MGLQELEAKEAERWPSVAFLLNKRLLAQATPVIPALEQLREHQDPEFRASLGYKPRSCLKTK